MTTMATVSGHCAARKCYTPDLTLGICARTVHARDHSRLAVPGYARRVRGIMARLLPNSKLSSPNKSPLYGQRIIFTGPDGIGDYKTKQHDLPRFIGIGPLSPESTGDLNYLFRAAPSTPPPLPKDCYVGGVGWGLQYCGTLNARTLGSDYQSKHGEFRSALEDRITHRFQNPWFVPPHVLDRQAKGARARLAWTHNLYDNYCQEENRDFVLLNRKRYAQRKVMGRPATQSSNVILPQIVLSR